MSMITQLNTHLNSQSNVSRHSKQLNNNNKLSLLGTHDLSQIAIFNWSTLLESFNIILGPQHKPLNTAEANFYKTLKELNC